MLEIDDRPWPQNCTRCGFSIPSINEAHSGHGWEMYCDRCEDSFKVWYEGGVTDLRRKQIDDINRKYDIKQKWIEEHQKRRRFKNLVDMMLNSEPNKCQFKECSNEIDYYYREVNMMLCNKHIEESKKFLNELEKGTVN